MPVPSTVNSIREQIREAVKLSLSSVCTPLATVAKWSSINDKTKYPLVKAVYADSSLLQEFIGSRDMREDTLFVEVAPWCVDADYELKTSVIAETYRPYFNTLVIQELMDPAYAPFCGKISVTGINILGTDLTNPYAVVRFTLSVNYMITG